MLYKEAVPEKLWETAKQLFSVPQLNSFRLVGDTAIALQLGHRISGDIDLFSNEKIDKIAIRRALNVAFPQAEIVITEDHLYLEINGIRVELYDDWLMPFKQQAIVEGEIRIASLEDLAAFKLSAITGRREKKDYIDLFFLFQKLGAAEVLNRFYLYDPLLSPKSILFALAEVNTARNNKSPMPDMLLHINWDDIVSLMLGAAKNFINQRRNDT